MDRVCDSAFGQRERTLHLWPVIGRLNGVQIRHSLRDVFGGKGPTAQYLKFLGADSVPVGIDAAGIGELAHFNVGSAVPDHLDALGSGFRISAAVQHEVSTEFGGGLAHGVDPVRRWLVGIQWNRGVGAIGSAERQPGMLGCSDDDDGAGSTLTSGDDGKDADRSWSLDDDGVTGFESIGCLRRCPVKGPGDRGIGFDQTSDHDWHVVR